MRRQDLNEWDKANTYKKVDALVEKNKRCYEVWGMKYPEEIYSTEQVEEIIFQFKEHIEKTFLLALNKKGCKEEFSMKKFNIILDDLKVKECISHLIRYEDKPEEFRKYQFQKLRYFDHIKVEKCIASLQRRFQKVAHDLKIEVYKKCAFSKQLKANLEPKCFNLIEELFKQYKQELNIGLDIINKKIKERVSYMEENKYIVENEYQKKVENKIEKNSDEQLQGGVSPNINKFLDILKNNGFEIEGGSLIKIMDNGKSKTIGNFIPFITRKRIYDNGLLSDNQIRYTLKGFLIGTWTELPEIEISKEEYNSFKFIIGSEWDKFAIVEAANQIYFRQVAQILSNETMEEETIFNHTGFRKIGNKLIYLYENGAIGDIDNIRADLSNDNLQQYNFTNITFDVTEALNKSLSILGVAKRNIAIPLLATTYISPLTSILQEEGIYADFILYFIGKSGSGKSSLVAAAGLSHFGNNFQRNNFPCSFRDSLNNLEKKAFILKDTLNVVDDLNPEGTGNLKIEKYEKITRNVWR